MDLNCSNRAKVIRNVKKVWNDLPQDYFKTLARSMPIRIRACIANDYDCLLLFHLLLDARAPNMHNVQS